MKTTKKIRTVIYLPAISEETQPCDFLELDPSRDDDMRLVKIPLLYDFITGKISAAEISEKAMDLKSLPVTSVAVVMKIKELSVVEIANAIKDPVDEILDSFFKPDESDYMFSVGVKPNLSCGFFVTEIVSDVSEFDEVSVGITGADGHSKNLRISKIGNSVFYNLDNPVDSGYCVLISCKHKDGDMTNRRILVEPERSL